MYVGGVGVIDGVFGSGVDVKFETSLTFSVLFFQIKNRILRFFAFFLF